MNIFKCIVLSFLILFFLAGFGQAAGKKEVLLLNSYHKGYSWTDDLVDGVGKSLSGEREDYELRVEYMDTKRINTPEYKEMFFRLMEMKYADAMPDVIMVSDDNAFHFMVKYHDLLFPNIPVVFLGVNHFEPAMIKGEENHFTGIIQEADISGTLSAALKLHPGTRRVAVICDATPTGHSYREQAVQAESRLKGIQFIYLDGRELTTQELLSRLRGLPEDSIALLCIWLKDKRGVFVPWERSYPKICESSSVPVYGVLDSMLEYGVLGGKVHSGRQHGIQAANVAKRILMGEDVSSIPIRPEGPKNYMFDYNQLKRWDIKKDMLPKGSLLVNKPESPYYRYKTIVWAAAAVFSFMFAAIALLLKSIARRRSAERILSESEEKYRKILETIEDGYYEVDLGGRLTFFNDQLCRILGYSRDEMVGMSYWRYTDKSTAGTIYKYFNEVFTTGRSAKGFVWELIRKDGTKRYTETSVSLIRDGQGRGIGFRGIARDVTDRKRAEEALRESEENLKAIIEASPDPVIFYDTEGCPRYFNPAFTVVFGWTYNELKGKQIPFVPEDQKEMTSMKIKELYEHGRPVRFETKRLTKEGEVLDVHISAAFIKGPEKGPAGMVVNLTDITERNRLESQFQAAQRMESIGTLAGGIAHDFNNLLMGIQGNVSLTIVDTDPSHPDYERLKNIEQLVQNGADLSKQLLGFARGGKYEVKPTNLNELIESQNRLFSRARKEITIRPRYEEKPWTVQADQGQVRQILMNLYVNAWQAMPGGGVLYVETQNVTIDENYSSPFHIEPGRYVKISVTDNGVGMDEATKQRIFEPFFTTKGMGRGTGLGLASVYGIVKNHGGFINAYSEKGKGSTFNIYFPAEEPEVSGSFLETTEKRISFGDETVLMVDDEEMVRDVGKKLLKRLGYRVFTARNGEEAIDEYRENLEDIHAIILDLVMPGMSGGETYDRLKEMDPEVKVLLSSGYSINGQAREIMNRGCNGFIQKPFNLRELSHKLREILDERED